MKICVINGSPKGKYSITLQTSLYLQQRFPEHSFSFLQAGQRIRTYEKDMTDAVRVMEAADLILFSYPVYTFLAPSQLQRFIELLKESGAGLKGKYVTQITTSKHFFDVTAHRYIEDNCHDLGMKVIHGLSADMDDLTKTQGRRDAEAFLKYVNFCMINGISEPAPKQEPGPVPLYQASLPAVPKKVGREIVIVADLKEEDDSLAAMIEDFRAVSSYPTRLVNIREYPFAGGCLGCFHCAATGRCIYKDGFDTFLREQIQTADAVCLAFSIRDHSMGARFKMYDDRQFCNGHRTVTEGMPFAYLIHGDYAAEENLRTVIEARSEVGHNFFCGAGTDADSIRDTAGRLTYAMEHHYLQPRNFYGVGGMKIFRDLIWLMQGLMAEDHAYYKKHGIYDFPQKQFGKMLAVRVLGSIVRSPKISARLGNRMTEGMLAPYTKVIREAKKRNRK